MGNILMISGALAMALAAPALAQGHGHGGGKDKGDHDSAQRNGDDDQRAHGENAAKKTAREFVERSGRSDHRAKAREAGRSNSFKDMSETMARDVRRVVDRNRDRDRNDSRERHGYDSAQDEGRNYYRRVVEGRGMIDGCPPGLAKKHNGCLPPGLAQKTYRGEGRYGALINGIPYRYRDLADDGYRYRDGYLYRTQGDSITSWLPLLGGALGVGEIFPQRYAAYPMPDYYRAYYGRSDDYRYLYADRAIFAVDPKTRAIQSIAALLTGDDWTVGQRAPSGYDVYNVPLSYRDRYYDTPSANYRYSDGYVYRIDPKTQLVAAAISLLT